jgi:type VI protein secretion system component VasK
VRVRNHALVLSWLLAALLVSGCVSVAQQNEMNVDRLSTAADDGAILAGLIVRGDAGSTFARAHARELQEDADRVRLSVADAQPSGDQRLEKLAEELSSTLGDLVAHPADRAVARHARAQLQALSQAISKASS